MTQTDAEVIAASCRKPERFAELFDRHAPHLHRYCARRAGPQAADDLVAETFLAAFGQRSGYDLAYPDARPWLYGIATNLLGTYQRQEIRQFRLLQAAAPRAVAAFDHAERVVATVAAQSARPRLAAALAGLAQPDRDVLLLIAWEDLLITRSPAHWRSRSARCGHGCTTPAHTTPAVSGQSEPSLRTATLTAKQVLDSAAAAALTGSPVIPRPDQYVYVKINDGDGIVQSWYSVDGRRGGLSDNAGLPPFVVPGCLPQTTASCTPRPAFFPDMPTTASAIGPWLAQTQGATTANPNVLGKIAGVILENDYLLPAQRAALYEFLATTPGLTVVHGVKDTLGRAGVGITWTFGGSATLVFDAGTLAYLGWNTVGLHGEQGGDALLSTAIVDRAGELPNG